MSALAEGKSFPLIHPVYLTSLRSAYTENRNMGVDPYMGRKERERERESQTRDRESRTRERESKTRERERERERNTRERESQTRDREVQTT